MIQKHGGKTQIVFIDKQEKIQEELQLVVPTQHQPPSKEAPLHLKQSIDHPTI